MPGYDEETVRRSRQGDSPADPDRQARPKDLGSSPNAGALESLGIGVPRNVDPDTASDDNEEEIRKDR